MIEPIRLTFEVDCPVDHAFSLAQDLPSFVRAWRSASFQGVHRRPVWSGVLTAPLAALIPVHWRPAALVVIKAAHTAVFFSVAGLILLFAWDGVRQRPGRRTVIAAGVALAESAVYASNNQVCPLTPLAEELGASSGSVTDIFLPDWLSRRIPLFGGSALVVGLVLNLRAWRGRRPAPHAST